MSNDLWYKDAVIYQLHVRSFQDSNGDGIGDFRGLIQRLDHFTELGVTALWLLPFYVSPLRDDGYDIQDYYAVNPSYGTVADFREFLEQAHARGLKVITELVLNHTSDQNAWFQRARHALPGSVERDYYVWSDTPELYQEARIIFKDFEPSNWTWDPVAKAYFWHRFYSHQPDLNFDNPKVHEELLRVVDFWLSMGVDGVRLDAVPYLYEREGTNGENLPETHAFLKKLRKHVDEHFDNRMLLAEANMWPEDSAAYFGDGDECHMNFHFPLMPRLFMTIQMEDRYPLVDILQQTPAIPSNCQWGIFLRNHDELTLEMVTDEERDYMYRVYAEDTRARINLGIRRRLAPLLGNDRKKIELINSLLLSMPGTPIIYYGDEIGMGDNFYLGDRNGVRTPMQWNSDRNAGFSTGHVHQLFLPVITDAEYHYTTVNVDVQRASASSLMSWMRRMLQTRRQSKALSSGDFEFLHPENARIIAFVRRYEDETVLVLANLSRYTQYVELDLSAFGGLTPVEMFGRSRMPDLKQGHTSFTVGPHGFLWYSLQRSGDGHSVVQWDPPVLPCAPAWGRVLQQSLESRVLPAYLQQCRWFGGKGRTLREVKMLQSVIYPETQVHLFLLETSFLEGLPEHYLLPLVWLEGQPAAQALLDAPLKCIARTGESHVLFDALHHPEFQTALFHNMTDGKVSLHPPFAAKLEPTAELSPDEVKKASANIRVLTGEQSNTSISYGDIWLLKFFRKFEAGIQPEVEMTRHLTQHEFNVPALISTLSLSTARRDGEGVIAMLAGYTHHQGDGWTYTLDALARYFDRVLDARLITPDTPVEQMVGAIYPERAAQLGRITADMHAALSRRTDDADFKELPFSVYYSRSLYQGMRANVSRVFRELRRQLPGLPDVVRQRAESVLARKDDVLKVYEKLLHVTVRSSLIRIHGDFHLGQVLNTGHDFVVIDFEGEPRLSLSERRLRRPALRDVAGMVRSFDYAASAALEKASPEDREWLLPWARDWTQIVTQAYLDAYFKSASGSAFVPDDLGTLQLLLDLHVLDKAIYEIGYELSYRPHLLPIPLEAVEKILAPYQQG
ncbi:maltose alpha-D-glucosyltransferase/alpha-amylase [Prosthecobacter fusiformis]|uniref:Maltokinase n=1 Tax=Prosthecobacter fusiformis TaxID=48464 RepID=A0A4V3FG54_9BACT|nr:maltose alpha-D-glucosyltransferase [Prosthecobacter fusiformis]TDU73333.1 maltose alpha-D-glucosyltransferase/alpha-amylase [Prosthecobacter fusiformis]